MLSYLIGLAASLDRRGRWAVLVGSASSLGTAVGPLAGSLLSARAGFPAMGTILAVGLLAIALPLTAVALHTGGRPLLPGAARRRTSAVVVAVTTGTPRARCPPSAHRSRRSWSSRSTAAGTAREEYDTAGPQQTAAAPGPGTL